MKVSMSGDLVEPVGAGGVLPKGQAGVVDLGDGVGEPRLVDLLLGLLALLLRLAPGEDVRSVVDAPGHGYDRDPHEDDEGQYVHFEFSFLICDMAMPVVIPTRAMMKPKAVPMANAITGTAPSRRRRPTRSP